METDYEMEAPKASKKLPVAGGIITTLWLTGAGLYALDRWSELTTLPPNAIGDFLAGTFAPLAFLWLVLGFFQQGEELRNSGKALWLQGKELQASVAQQRDLVKVTRDQLQFESQRLEHERKEIERRAKPILTVGLGSSTPGTAPHTRIYEFKIDNAGAPCTAVTVELDDQDVATVPLLSTGDSLKFRLQLPIEDVAQMAGRVRYLDARALVGAARFTILRKGTKFTFSHE